MPSRRLLVSLVFLVPLSILGQAKPGSDAETDGLLGPVQSVSTTITTTSVKWQQPGGPALIVPVMCRECDYDRSGARTLSGEFSREKFVGESIDIVRGPDGNIRERIATDAQTGLMVRDEIDGPYGQVDVAYYDHGVFSSRNTRKYDPLGYLAEELGTDESGHPIFRSVTRSNAKGDPLDKAEYGKDGSMRWHQTYDPESDTTAFTRFDDSGAVALTWTVVHDRVRSFWEAEESQTPQYGDSFFDKREDGTIWQSSCHKGGVCDPATIRYEYVDKDHHFPRSSEWKDGEGKLLYGAYFEYQFDSFGNWISRVIRVWNRELGERTLYETDARTIAYWQ